MEQDIKDDLQAGLWDLVNSSSIDLGVQLPKVKSLTVERDLTYLLIQPETGDEAEDDYNSEELKDPNCPWYEEDVQFESFDENNVTSKINTSEKFLLGLGIDSSYYFDNFVH